VPAHLARPGEPSLRCVTTLAACSGRRAGAGGRGAGARDLAVGGEGGGGEAGKEFGGFCRFERSGGRSGATTTTVEI